MESRGELSLHDRPQKARQKEEARNRPENEETGRNPEDFPEAWSRERVPK